MRVALIHPPTCDPTAPYLAIPALCGFLRKNGVEVLPIDANLEAWEHLLSKQSLQTLGERIERRLRRLERQARLSHVEQLAYTALWRARADALVAPVEIEKAAAVMSGRVGGFFDSKIYGAAVATLESAFSAIGAAYSPMNVDFTAFKKPFSMLDMREIERSALEDGNPFHNYFTSVLLDRIEAFAPDVCGLSVAFPGQIELAYAMALIFKRAFPDKHLTVGGPALTQLFARLDAQEAAAALKPFDTAVMFEGEKPLLDLVRDVERGGKPRGVIRGGLVVNLDELPAPDFRGLPLDRYFSPELVLPYDPSRGCYHGKCAFCHYGLAEQGAAPYRERSPGRVAEDLASLAAAHGAKIFYLSEDTISPAHLSGISAELRGATPRLKFATDLRPEKAVEPKACRAWADAGLVATALGVESASPRILRLMRKGLKTEDCARAIAGLTDAGVAVEVMCFTDFPSETAAEALETIRFLDRRSDRISLFMCGIFSLTHGSAVAENPGTYGIEEIWSVAGDEFRTGVFYREQRGKTEAERLGIEEALDAVSSRYSMRSYPFAGSLSTAHTLLWFERLGPRAFALPAVQKRGFETDERGGSHKIRARYDVPAIAKRSDDAEARIWDELVYEKRRVSRSAYRELARELESSAPVSCEIRISAGMEPKRIMRRLGTNRKRKSKGD